MNPDQRVVVLPEGKRMLLFLCSSIFDQSIERFETFYFAPKTKYHIILNSIQFHNLSQHRSFPTENGLKKVYHKLSNKLHLRKKPATIYNPLNHPAHISS